MVNNNTIKKKILDNLRNSETPISGEVLALQFGFSRVALWKHINTLKEAGYNITSGAKGYEIDKTEDYLYPWEFPDFTDKIAHFAQTKSTMDEALNKNYNDGTVIVAESQNEGRGTGGRTWTSQNGGLFFTMVNKKDIPGNLYLSESMRSLVILYDLLKNTYNLDVCLKWPNDILFGDKKLAGVLSECFISGDKCKFINIGIGLNVNNTPNVSEAVSLTSILNRKTSRRDLLQNFIKMYNQSADTQSEPINIYKKLLLTSNKKIRFKKNGVLTEGFIEEISRTGEATINNGNKKIKIYPGERENEK